ncbi:MAG TPA: proton-conducting membrane transporter [Eubacteriaceae bacterium]|nr:proton-conducting membrane transporter [Eubacteriaceae bacterium]
MLQLHLLIILPLMTSVVTLLFPKRRSTNAVIASQLALFCFAGFFFLNVKMQGLLVENIGGWASLYTIVLRADLLAMVMVLLTTFLFLSVVVFNRSKDYANDQFLFLLLLLESLIIGIFLSNDLFNLFVLIEVATVVISILIMYKRETRAIYDGMLYLLVNVVGMTFFLFGTGMLYVRVGTINITAVHEILFQISNKEMLYLPYAMILTGISLKAALLPLFSWLPKAHGTPSAPTIVSAILSGLYVKTGVYLFLRIQEMFAPAIQLDFFFLMLGFLTAVIGFLLAIFQDDIKLILAYSTVSQIGLIMTAVSSGNEGSYWGGVYHIVNHAVFKSALFLASGVIVDAYKTRNINRIKGVFQRMPLVATSMVLAILGITGAPFFNGSMSKYWIATGISEIFGDLGMFVINLGTILIFIRFSTIFFGGKKQRAIIATSRKLVIGFISGLCFAGGVFARELIRFFFGIELGIDPMSYVEKSLVYLIAVTVGIMLYHFVLKKIRIKWILQKLELGFNGIAASILVYFVMLLGALHLI